MADKMQMTFLPGMQAQTNIGKSTTGMDFRSLSVFSNVPPAHCKPQLKKDGAEVYKVWEWEDVYYDNNDNLQKTNTKIFCQPGYGEPDPFDGSVAFACLNLAYWAELDGMLDKTFYKVNINIKDILVFLGYPECHSEYKQKVVTSIERCINTKSTGDIWFDTMQSQAKHKTSGAKAIIDVEWDKSSKAVRQTKHFEKIVESKPPETSLFTDIKNGHMLITINREIYELAKKQKLLLNLSTFRVLKRPEVQAFFRFFNERVTRYPDKDAFEFDIQVICQKFPGINIEKSKTGQKRDNRDLFNSLKRGLFKTLFEAGVIQNIDNKRDKVKKNGSLFITLTKGPFYDETLSSTERNNYLRIYKDLTEVVKIKDSLAHKYIRFGIKDLRDKEVGEPIFFEVLVLCILKKQEIPNFFKKGPEEWLNACMDKFKNGNGMNVTSQIQTIEYMRDNVPLNKRTPYQLSWDELDIGIKDQLEGFVFNTCIDWGIEKGRVLNWLKRGLHKDYIQRLSRIYNNLKTKEQNPRFLCDIIEKEDKRVWREAVPGSEHASVSRGDIKDNSSIMPDEIIIVKDDQDEINIDTQEIDIVKDAAIRRGIQIDTIDAILNTGVPIDEVKKLLGL